jgi:hypothetical protein
LFSYLEGKTEIQNLKRTFTRIGEELSYFDNPKILDLPQREVGTPYYGDLKVTKYLSTLGTPNPMHRLWNDGFWNKLTMAHGCYWGKCTFCDVSLDYIGRYEPIDAKIICDRIEEIIVQTGQTGFHFVDEAAPPALMRDVAIEILRRNLIITWWTNIRFEKSFTMDLCALLAASGCVAVSGGLEVASDRLLKEIAKGVSVSQVTLVTHRFQQNDIRVHAYLMYGFPTQTEQETIDSLEVVRQLFENDVVNSGFWHRFSMTIHSPVGLDPEKFGAKPASTELSPFANNDVDHEDQLGAEHHKFEKGLNASLYNYMHGTGFDIELQDWFDFDIPTTSHPHNYIRTIIENDHTSEQGIVSKSDLSKRIIWIGNEINGYEDQELNEFAFAIHYKNDLTELGFTIDLGKWLVDQINVCKVQGRLNDKGNVTTLKSFRDNFNATLPTLDFDDFWFSEEIGTLKKAGLLLV